MIAGNGIKKKTTTNNNKMKEQLKTNRQSVIGWMEKLDFFF